MGKKIKLTKLVILFVAYFFLGISSGVYNGSHTGTCSIAGTSESALQWFTWRNNVHSHIILEQSSEAYYLLSSVGNWYAPNSSITAPEDTKFVVVAQVSYISNMSIYVTADGENVSGWFSLPLGAHHIEVRSDNNTLARRDVTITTQEAYEAMKTPDVEPAGLRWKSAIVAALAAAITAPIGMYIKRRRAREEVL